MGISRSEGDTDSEEGRPSTGERIVGTGLEARTFER